MAKIILTQEVTGLGTPGDVVEVKDGYARNYLYPRGYALRWTRGGEAHVEAINAARAAKAHKTLETAQEQAAALAKTPVRLQVKAGKEGRLFGTVRTEAVASAVEEAGLGAIDKRKVVLPGHIKSTGNYDVAVRLHDEVTATINLQVVAAK